MPDFFSQTPRNPSPFNFPTDVAGGSISQARENLGFRTTINDPSALQVINTDSIQSEIERRNERIRKFYEDLENQTQGIKYRDPHTSSIEKQIAHIRSINGYARPTRFYFELEGLLWGVNDRLVRNCQTMSIPGRALQTQPLKIYGPPKEFVYEANFQNEFQMTFRVGEDMFERDFFENWLNLAMSNKTYDLEYPSTYRSTLRIYQLDQSDYKVYCTELYNVFCKSVGDMELSTDSMDTISTVNISLAYSDYLVVGKRRDPLTFGETTESSNSRSLRTSIEARQEEARRQARDKKAADKRLDSIISSGGWAARSMVSGNAAPDFDAIYARTGQ